MIELIVGGIFLVGLMWLLYEGTSNQRSWPPRLRGTETWVQVNRRPREGSKTDQRGRIWMLDKFAQFDRRNWRYSRTEWP